ncbi:FMN-binding negative transcriptional regulator [Christiangramia sabulilitoris]|uniref:FMN-binding negative transcriptional regulator n=1 Tax=Christiangramia sabulilitoris TaxID=2583991 RepID=A0A550I079_9FLAO|nr:FMN-binding negative transcriptional regulator [Christiangramia sabulilitoris]TRO64386.1 FMN-binding negative transcriptional regulator [Christiangramia sabulilitoris]
MYRPEKYIKDDKDFVFSFMRENPFASFIMKVKELVGTHIPVLAEGDENEWILYSHMANHNKQSKLLENGAEALVIFHGPHSYISSSWYKEKDISTWDYSAVHVNARIRLQTRKELEVSLEKLVRHFEKEQQEPLFYKDIPEDMLSSHLPLITGFWLEPYKVEGIAKLHQSYSSEDILRVTDKLEQSGECMHKKIAQDIMNQNKNKLKS